MYAALTAGGWRVDARDWEMLDSMSEGRPLIERFLRGAPFMAPLLFDTSPRDPVVLAFSTASSEAAYPRTLVALDPHTGEVPLAEAIDRFYTNVTWTGTIEPNGMGPGSPAMTSSCSVSGRRRRSGCTTRWSSSAVGSSSTSSALTVGTVPGGPRNTTLSRAVMKSSWPRCRTIVFLTELAKEKSKAASRGPVSPRGNAALENRGREQDE